MTGNDSLTVTLAIGPGLYAVTMKTAKVKILVAVEASNLKEATELGEALIKEGGGLEIWSP